MALPILETQSFDLTLPSADIKVKFRPCLLYTSDAADE